MKKSFKSELERLFQLIDIYENLTKHPSLMPLWDEAKHSEYKNVISDFQKTFNYLIHESNANNIFWQFCNLEVFKNEVTTSEVNDSHLTPYSQFKIQLELCEDKQGNVIWSKKNPSLLEKVIDQIDYLTINEYHRLKKEWILDQLSNSNEVQKPSFIKELQELESMPFRKLSKENPFPHIFSSPYWYDFFILLIDRYKECDQINNARLSLIYQHMRHDDEVNPGIICNHKTYRDFCLKELNYKMTKIKMKEDLGEATQKEWLPFELEVKRQLRILEQSEGSGIERN